MKKWVVVLLSLLFTGVLLSKEVMIVNKADGSLSWYELDTIKDLTFTTEYDVNEWDSTSHKLIIKKSDGVYKDFYLLGIGNLTFSDLTGIEHDQLLQNMGISLVKNYPNPFNPETTISFEIGKEGMTKVEIYNHLGQLLTELHNGRMKAGSYYFKWDAARSTTSSGVYIVKVSKENDVVTSKMILIK